MRDSLHREPGNLGDFARMRVEHTRAFAMLARLMVSTVQPWEVALSVGILLLTITIVALATVRIYATGVLLYGQRPGLRRFIAAARRAG